MTSIERKEKKECFKGLFQRFLAILVQDYSLVTQPIV